MATNAPNYVSLTSDNYDTQLADILRRQKYAELLAQQGNEDIKVENVNGVPTPISPFQGLAKVFQTGMGAYLGGKAAEDAAALKKSERSQLIENLKNYETAPGDTISMPEQSISANMPAIPRATFDRATGTLVPGADTQTTPTNINIPKYELAAASRPRTLTEKGDLALQYAQNGSPETSAMWTGRYADVAKKQQLLANLVPQAEAALINKATPPNLLPVIETAMKNQDVDRLDAALKLAQEKGTLSAKDQNEFNDEMSWRNSQKASGKPATHEAYVAEAERLKSAAQGAGGLASKKEFARFENGLPARPTASDTEHRTNVTAWLAKPENKGKNSTDYDIWLSGQKTGAGTAATLAATDAFTAGIKTDNPIVVNAANSLASGETRNITAVPAPYRSAVQERLNNAGVDAWSPALRGQVIRNAAALIKPYTSLPSYQSMAGALTTIARMNAAMKTNTVASSLELVDAAVGLAKGGPNSARTVTEAQVSFITSGQSPAQWLSNLRNQIVNGSKLSDEQRQQIYTVAKATAGEYKKTYGDIYGQITDKLTANNIPKALWPLPDLDKLVSPGSAVGKNGPVPASAKMSQEEWNHVLPEELKAFK